MDKSNITKKQIVIGVIGGIFVGFLSGFFGGGGGMIVVPLLAFGMGLEDRNAHATAISVILPLSVTSSIVYITQGNINWLQLLYATIGFVVGGAVGALLLNKMNNVVIRIIFAIIMILAGIKILF